MTSHKANGVARERARALAAAQEQLEPLLTANETTILAAHERTFTVEGLTARRDGTPVGSIDVERAEPPLYRIEVRIRWLGPYGNETFTIDTTVLPE